MAKKIVEIKSEKLIEIENQLDKLENEINTLQNVGNCRKCPN